MRMKSCEQTENGSTAGSSTPAEGMVGEEALSTDWLELSRMALKPQGS